ncbi:hypothetical protein BKA63DRAFT_575984 [Paraphoma chrysanthemicola]|nr:hypothetical protein BKA63DRAFT_575984 [Paraphoma chrysanthemicola]
MYPSTYQSILNEKTNMSTHLAPHLIGQHDISANQVNSTHDVSTSNCTAPAIPEAAMHPFSDLTPTDLHRARESLKTFLYTFMHTTIHLFTPPCPSLCSRAFWSAQLRSELEYVLWQPGFLGREATEAEVDIIVAGSLDDVWLRVQKILDGWERVRKGVEGEVGITGGDERVRKARGGGSLRREFGLEEEFEGLRIDGDEEFDEAGEVEDDYGRVPIGRPDGVMDDSEDQGKTANAMAMVRPLQARMLLWKELRDM